jgi:hypothetical protein
MKVMKNSIQIDIMFNFVHFAIRGNQMKKVVKKDDLVGDCMALLSKTYQRDSKQYEVVKKALYKLTNVDIDCLYVMLLTSIK